MLCLPSTSSGNNVLFPEPSRGVTKCMKFLVIGLGSMGSRRIRNLQFHNEQNIIGFDLASERRREAEKKYGIKTVADLTRLKKGEFDAVIISTPPDKHGDAIRFALKNKKHFFAEVGTTNDGYGDIKKYRGATIVMAPSCTFRYFAPIAMIKKLLDAGRIGKILAFQYHMGQYLPDWHPWEDYRKVYFSKKETGACKEMLAFELIWLNWIINSEVAEISGFVDKVSDLDMDADDIILANLKYKNNIFGNVVIDVISRKPFRTLRVLGSEGVLDWERFDSVIKIYDAKSKKTELINVPNGNPEKGYVNEEEMYNDEVGAWLGAIRGKASYPYTFKDSRRNLEVLYKLEASGK